MKQLYVTLKRENHSQGKEKLTTSNKKFVLSKEYAVLRKVCYSILYSINYSG
jgi:hypothetical protein